MRDPQRRVIYWGQGTPTAQLAREHNDSHGQSADVADLNGDGQPAVICSRLRRY
jgi:hypothetical protein